MATEQKSVAAPTDWTSTAIVLAIPLLQAGTSKAATQTPYQPVL
jgi:hypothetical protein